MSQPFSSEALKHSFVKSLVLGVQARTKGSILSLLTNGHPGGGVYKRRDNPMGNFRLD